MALTRLTIDGYAQVELNQVAFRRDGRIEAQLPLDATDFASAMAENGMVLVVDRVAGSIKMPKTGVKGVFALNYSSEHMYDERKPGLKNFALGKNDVLPRLGYLDLGDKFTTNCLSYDSASDSTFTSDDAVITALDNVKTSKVYAVPAADGSWKLTKSAPTSGLYCVVEKKTTMPDGQVAVKLQVISL